MYKASVILLVIGLLLLIVGIALPMVFPSIFLKKLNEKLVLREDSEVIKSFKKSTVPMYYKVRLFNLTNPQEVLDGKQAILKENGPYTYRMEPEKIDLSWNHEEGSLAHKSKKFYFFEPSMSIGDESDIITTINPVFTFIGALVGDPKKSSMIPALAQAALMRFKLEPFVTKTVGELTFAGYDDPFISHMYKLLRKPKHKAGKTGYMLGKNGTAGSEFQIYTGEHGMDNYRQILRYKDMTSLPYWKTEGCNMINGSDGSAFPRPIDKTKFEYIFSGDLCRSIGLRYEKDVVYGPLTLHRLYLPKESLVDKCFCTSEFECRDTMINTAPCKDGLPVVMSTPHFYMGERSDQEMVVGLNPNKNDHETYLDIEPNTGFTIRVSKRIQVNMPLRRYANLPALQNVKEVILPVFWVDENAEAPLSRAEAIHRTLTLPKNVVFYGSWALIVIGVVLILMASCIACITYKKGVEEQYQRNVDQITGKKLLSKPQKN